MSAGRCSFYYMLGQERNIFLTASKCLSERARLAWESRDLGFSPASSTNKHGALGCIFQFLWGLISLMVKCEGIRLEFSWPSKKLCNENSLTAYNQQQSFPLTCCYNYPPEEPPAHAGSQVANPLAWPGSRMSHQHSIKAALSVLVGLF